MRHGSYLRHVVHRGREERIEVTRVRCASCMATHAVIPPGVVPYRQFSEALVLANNGIERLNRKIKRHTNAVGSFPDGRSVMMLAEARCKYVVNANWAKRRYLDISLMVYRGEDSQD